MLKNIIKILSVINNKIGLIGSFFILLLIFLVSLSVILRYVFQLVVIWLQDLYIWTHAIFILLGDFLYTKKGWAR